MTFQELQQQIDALMKIQDPDAAAPIRETITAQALVSMTRGGYGVDPRIWAKQLLRMYR